MSVGKPSTVFFYRCLKARLDCPFSTEQLPPISAESSVMKYCASILIFCCVLVVGGCTTPHEAGLLRKAPNDANARKELATLWNEKHLSSAAKKAIVNHFVTFKLVEEYPYDLTRFPARRELEIMAHIDFPFPQSAWVQFGANIAVDRKPVLAADYFGSGIYSLCEPPANFGSHSGVYPGHPEARALVQMREVIYEKSHQQTLWVIRKELEPITLRQEE
jgi:hypothetical protein